MYGVTYYDEYNEDNVCYEFIYDVPNNGIVNMFIYNFLLMLIQVKIKVVIVLNIVKVCIVIFLKVL